MPCLIESFSEHTFSDINLDFKIIFGKDWFKGKISVISKIFFKKNKIVHCGITIIVNSYYKWNKN